MEIKFNNHPWKIRLYTEGLDLSFISNESECGMDTEFEVCQRGVPKKIVVMQVAWLKASICDIIPWPFVQHYIQEVEKISKDAGNDIIWNLFPAGVDLDAVDYRKNYLFEHAFRHDKYLVRDMMMRYCLYEQSIGEFYEARNLAHYTKKYLGVVLDKDDAVRLNFRQDKALTDQEILYGGMDAIATLMLAQVIPEQPLEDVKTHGAIALHFCGERGYPADLPYLKKQQAEELQNLHSVYEYLTDWGFWPTSILTRDEATGEIVPQKTHMSGGVKELMRILNNFEKRYNLQFKRTPTGSISTANTDPQRAFLVKNLPIHPLISAYKEFKHAEHMLSSYLKPALIGHDGKWHPWFKPMMKNGRTSAVAPPIQTYPQKGGHRGVFCASPGHLILTIDINQAELCALAQSNYTRFGRSKMRELIIDGYNLHRWFAKEYICNRIYHKNWDLSSPDEQKSMYKDAKPVNFGLPGGLGVSSFQDYALNSWGREFNTQTIIMLMEAWFEAYPENRDHLKPVEDAESTLKCMHTELRNLNIAKFHLLRSVEDVCSCLADAGWSRKEISNFCFRNRKYQVTTFHGHRIRNCNFTDACNYAFSVPTADAMSGVLGEAERLGLPLINFVHDEFHFLLPCRDENKLQAQVVQCVNLVRDETQKRIPDVPIQVEPALTHRWYKEAEPVWHDDGTLGVWTPSQEP